MPRWSAILEMPNREFEAVKDDEFSEFKLNGLSPIAAWVAGDIPKQMEDLILIRLCVHNGKLTKL